VLAKAGRNLVVHAWTATHLVKNRHFTVAGALQWRREDIEVDDELTMLKPLYEWYEYHERKGGVLFPTYSSLTWFVRQHGDQLVDAGVLLRGRGGRPSLVTPDFGKAVYNTFFRREG